MKKAIILALSALILTGCYHSKTSYVPNASPSPVQKSTGDVDKELEEIDKELQAAEKEDLPSVDEKSLGL